MRLGRNPRFLKNANRAFSWGNDAINTVNSFRNRNKRREAEDMEEDMIWGTIARIGMRRMMGREEDMNEEDLLIMKRSFGREDE